MAEVITYWPDPKGQPAAQFIYPWAMWTRLDENGHGDIWLCEQGVDFPAEMAPVRFRSVLYNRANRETVKRKKDAPQRLVRVPSTDGGPDKVRKVLDFKPLRVKVVTVSLEQVAFQFFDSAELPPPPSPSAVAIPRRRQLHRVTNQRRLERVYS